MTFASLEKLVIDTRKNTFLKTRKLRKQALRGVKVTEPATIAKVTDRCFDGLSLVVETNFLVARAVATVFSDGHDKVIIRRGITTTGGSVKHTASVPRHLSLTALLNAVFLVHTGFELVSALNMVSRHGCGAGNKEGSKSNNRRELHLAVERFASKVGFEISITTSREMDKVMGCLGKRSEVLMGSGKAESRVAVGPFI